MITIDVDYCGDKNDAKHESEMFGIKIEVIGDRDQSCAFVTGTKLNIVNWLQDVHHQGESEEELKEIYGFE
jgi:hypothetical protein